MALHGPIAITMTDGSNKVIGYWGARRTVDLDDAEQTSIYECEVSLNGQGEKFTVEHRYSEGALVLLRKVVAAATGYDDGE